jgi:hypothetical protein
MFLSNAKLLATIYLTAMRVTKVNSLYYDPPDRPTKDVMEFRLVYSGNLIKAQRGSSTKFWEKHQIRRHFSDQLKTLWENHPVLQFYSQPLHSERGGFADYVVRHYTTIEEIAKQYEGYVPVAAASYGAVCELDVLFLRQEPPGGLINHNAGGGDIDNRMKVLIDALSIPPRGSVPPRKANDPPDPQPFFVLLSDDSIVTSLRITVDRLLVPLQDPPEPSDSCVVVHANIKAYNPDKIPISNTDLEVDEYDL